MEVTGDWEVAGMWVGNYRDGVKGLSMNSNRLLKNHIGTEATQHSRRSGTAPERPAGWSKRPSSEAAASEETKGGVLCSVRRASKRRENKAGGLFDHPAKTKEVARQIERSARHDCL